MPYAYGIAKGGNACALKKKRVNEGMEWAAFKAAAVINPSTCPEERKEERTIKHRESPKQGEKDDFSCSPARGTSVIPSPIWFFGGLQGGRSYSIVVGVYIL